MSVDHTGSGDHAGSVDSPPAAADAGGAGGGMASKVALLERVRRGVFWVGAVCFALVLLLLGAGTLAVAPGDPTTLALFFVVLVVGTAVFVATAILDS